MRSTSSFKIRAVSHSAYIHNRDRDQFTQTPLARIPDGVLRPVRVHDRARLFTTLFDHPESPVHRAIDSHVLRRVALGALMAMVTAAIVYSPWGKRSDAHINPAVTWAFFRLGKIAPRDAVLSTIAQFIGAVLAPLSGMSMNPARSFCSDFVRQAWPAIWLYFVALVVVILLAAEVYW